MAIRINWSLVFFSEISFVVESRRHGPKLVTFYSKEHCAKPKTFFPQGYSTCFIGGCHNPC